MSDQDRPLRERDQRGHHIVPMIPTPTPEASGEPLSEQQIRYIVSLCGPPEAFAADLPLITQGPVFVRRLLAILDEERAASLPAAQGATHDGCDWNPEKNAAAAEGEPHTTTVPATWMVGSDGDWRLCDGCAALPQFNRYTVRKRIQRPPAQGADVAPFEAVWDATVEVVAARERGYVAALDAQGADVAAIRARLAAITGDRWVVNGPAGDAEDGVAVVAERADVPTGGTPTNGMVAWFHKHFGAMNADANAAFVAHAPADVAYLLAALAARLSPPQAVETLVVKWRKEADEAASMSNTMGPARARAVQLSLEACADELAALRHDECDERTKREQAVAAAFKAGQASVCVLLGVPPPQGAPAQEVEPSPREAYRQGVDDGAEYQRLVESDCGEFPIPEPSYDRWIALRRDAVPQGAPEASVEALASQIDRAVGDALDDPKRGDFMRGSYSSRLARPVILAASPRDGPMKIRTICRCDEDGKPAGEHSSDCPYQAWLYQQAIESLREGQEQQRARETGDKP